MDSSDSMVLLAPPKVTAALCGVVLIAYGLTGVAFGGAEFTTAFPDGRAAGDAWLGLEGNGWTNLLFVACGSMLISAAPGLWGARVMDTLVALVFLAFAVVARLDGHDVLGVVAANGWTTASWAVVALVLLLGGRWPGRAPVTPPPPVGVRTRHEAGRAPRL